MGTAAEVVHYVVLTEETRRIHDNAGVRIPWHWTHQQVWDYIKTNNLPYNPLHDQTIQASDAPHAHGQLSLVKTLEVDVGGKLPLIKNVDYI